MIHFAVTIDMVQIQTFCAKHMIAISDNHSMNATFIQSVQSCAGRVILTYPYHLASTANSKPENELNTLVELF